MITYSFCSLNLKSLLATVYSTYTFVFIAADNLTNHQACIVIVWCSSFATSVQLFYLFIYFIFYFKFLFFCSGVAAMQNFFFFFLLFLAS